MKRPLALASIHFAAAAEVTVRVAREENAFTDYDNLAGSDHATRVSYRANITPGFPLPAIVGWDVRAMVDSVGREMLLRAIAIDQGGPIPVGPAGR